MAYDGYHSPQHPYEQQAGFNNGNNINNNNSSNNNAYGSPQAPQNTFFQTPYPDHQYDRETDHPRTPSHPQFLPPPGPPPPGPPPPQVQPPPLRPHPGNAQEQASSPARLYQPNTAPIAQTATAAYQNIPAATAPVNGPAVSPYLSQEFLSQITQQITTTVIQNLSGLNLGNAIGTQQQQPQPRTPHSPHPSRSLDLPPFPPSVSTQSDYSPNTRVYTPQSPYKSSEEQLYSSPTLSQTPHRTQSRMHHHPTADQDRRPQTPYGGMDAQQRPELGQRHSTQDGTTIERLWGHFFDRDGKPTQQLGQLLRGIAKYLIKIYPPGNTMVVTPEKMQKYYEDTRVPGDNYPWQDIFNHRRANISRLLRDVQAEHHLVQDRLNSKPEIPGLTARGFERWMTLMIQARPDQEFDRLQMTLLNMPINNPEEKEKRFQKHLPRRLLPKSGDQIVRKRLEDDIVRHCNIERAVFASRSSSRPAPHRQRGISFAEGTSRKASPLEFDRRGPNYNPSVEDEPEEETLSHPIERKRMPYLVQSGGGRTFENPSGTRVPSPIDIPSDHGHDWSRSPPENLGGFRQAGDGHPGSYGPSTTPGGYPDDLGGGRHREEREDNDRIYDDLGQDRGRGRYDQPARGSWNNDEDFYRSSGLPAEDSRRGQYDRPWPPTGRY